MCCAEVKAALTGRVNPERGRPTETNRPCRGAYIIPCTFISYLLRLNPTVQMTITSWRIFSTFLRIMFLFIFIWQERIREPRKTQCLGRTRWLIPNKCWSVSLTIAPFYQSSYSLTGLGHLPVNPVLIKYTYIFGSWKKKRCFSY